MYCRTCKSCPANSFKSTCNKYEASNVYQVSLLNKLCKNLVGNLFEMQQFSLALPANQPVTGVSRVAIIVNL